MDTTLVESLKSALKADAARWHTLNERSWDALESGDIDAQTMIDTDKHMYRMLVSFAWTSLKNMGIHVEWPIA